MDFAEMSSKFQEEFGKAADRKYFAPGRINIIGEHIDYNGGLVFPSPITLGTYALVGKREDKLVRAYSINFEKIGIIEFSLDNLEYNKEHNWVNYLKGVAKALIEEDYALQHGFDIVVYGNIPNGSGLSSSASLEMLSVTIFKDLFENQYIGVNSGIMDQFAIALGKKDHVILLDCNTLEYSYHPLQLEKHSIVIMNTNKRRELADSKYNERRSECESALEKLQTVCTANNLCEITLEELEANKELLTEVEYRRVHHVITDARVKQATTALAEGDLVQLGQLLNGSHTSLCKDYEVTGIELDTLAEAAWQVEGVLGARMTGAGFGGCGIALVENECVDNFIEQVGKKYKEVIGYEASFFVANIGDGPIRVD